MLIVTVEIDSFGFEDICPFNTCLYWL